MNLTSNDLKDAAIAWLQHRKWSVLSAEKVGGTERGVIAYDIVASKGNKKIKFLILQHWVFFDPLDFVEPDDKVDINHFLIPKNDLSYDGFDPDDHHAILCFNSSRTYAVFVDANVWNFTNLLESGTKLVHRDDMKCLPVPWRLWALDALPEWLQRGWPNPVIGKCGTVGDRSSWQFHPNWHVNAMKAAESFKRLPTNPDEAPNFHCWRSKGYYRAWLDDPDDLVLPWYSGDEPEDASLDRGRIRDRRSGA